MNKWGKFALLVTVITTAILIATRSYDRTGYLNPLQLRPSTANFTGHPDKSLQKAGHSDKSFQKAGHSDKNLQKAGSSGKSLQKAGSSGKNLQKAI